ncbi:hypothetical protein OPV22_007234 [Ensete ventricosum]|uniref:Uncharacterized protein n=1 Tax=Ensete ventricosum TaxID=4639 RepID=A0AAV8RRD1_ENSVE|nr:hypothetical protein OPV22_007234 [Ensete ventricosum]
MIMLAGNMIAGYLEDEQSPFYDDFGLLIAKDGPFLEAGPTQVRQYLCPRLVSYDDGGEVYVAHPLKISPSVDKSLDYIYLFHSWKASRTASNKNVSNASHVVGKMKVSSSLIVNSRRSKFMEIEFVLFGANEESLKEKEKPLSNIKKSNGQSKKVVEMFRPSHSYMHNHKLKFGESGSRFEDLWQLFSNELQTIYESDCADQLTNGFPPNLELAAIVVGDHRYNSSKDAAFGGWGLKFLEKVELNDADFSRGLPSSSSKCCQEQSESERKKTAGNVTVLVPDGFHGGPVAEFGGPSNLIDRWKTNGHCDCGGWDAGCPIKVLNNESNSSKILPQAEMGEDCKSFELFIEGCKHGEPAFQLLNELQSSIPRHQICIQICEFIFLSSCNKERKGFSHSYQQKVNLGIESVLVLAFLNEKDMKLILLKNAK